MSGNVNIGQITVNVNDTIPPDNYATVDAGTKVGTVYTKEQNNAWRKEVEQNTNAGIKGVAKPDDTIVTTGFYRMLANTAETFTNYKDVNDAPIIVTSDDLNVVNGVQRNEVIIEVNNGVSEKKIFAKVGADGANGTATIPQWVAGSYSPNAMVIDNFIQYIAPNGTTATDIPGESDKWVSIGKKIIENLLKNPDFESGFVVWDINQDFTATVINGILEIDTNGVGVTAPALVQVIPIVKAGVYTLTLKIKNKTTSKQLIRYGIYGNLIDFYLEVSNDFQFISFDCTVNSDITNAVYLVQFPLQTQFDINNLYFLEKGSNLTLEISKNEILENSFYPQRKFNKSPFFDKLQPFFEKMQNRVKDVCLVQIGDSISTNLNWSSNRNDAMYRPPLMTNFNVNSYLEEKLRWKEQNYYRFDVAGIFTDALGGGSSSIKDTDPNWGFVGEAYYLPLTKVIDGGTNSGVSFKLNPFIKRQSLIVHTDKQWASSTQITVNEGDGNVEVWDGNAWVEANGFTLNLKEPDTLASLGFYTDNYQKRIKFRRLNGLVNEYTINVRNVGAGRFAYWGLETSVKEFIFTYIAASKGSHNIAKLRQYESFMVDEFNPDLILQQCCILNQALGQDRGYDFTAQFEVYYDDLVAKGYLVFPYILWASIYSNFIDANGNFLTIQESNGNTLSCFDDVNRLALMYDEKNAPNLNLFNPITEIGLFKSKIDRGNLYTSALAGSSKVGNSFTIDGTHMNDIGELVSWRLLEEYFNF